MKSNPPEIEKGVPAGVQEPDSSGPGDDFSIEEALGESDESLKTIFDNVNAVIVRMNKYGKIIETNAKAEDCFGFKREEVIGKHFAKLGVFSMKDLPKLVKLFSDAIRGKITTYIDELEVINKNGQRINIKLYSTIVKKDGKIEGTVSIIHDVTEHRMAEEALRLSEEKFSKVFNASLNPICIVTVEDLKFIEINESFTRFTGYTRDEAIGHSSMELGLWVNEDNINTMTKILMEKGRLYNHEFRSRMKSGEIRIALFSAEVMDIGGRMCLIYVITDITEQKWAEDALKESEEFTSSLLTNTPNPIFVTYPDRAIKYVNPAFEKLTGFTLTEIIGMKTPYPWWPEETREEIEARFEEAKFGDGTPMEMAYQKKNGERFWVELNATEIKKDGERKYILINWVDITERKQMETALRDSEEKFSKAFNTSPNVMSITTLDGTFIEVNESFLRMAGLTREHVIGRSSHELNLWGNPDDRNSFAEKIKEHGRLDNEEYQFHGKSGELHTVLFSAEKINIGGKPCLISVNNDITKRKQMEEALRFSDAAFKSIHESVIALDNDRIITYWNNISEQIFGIAASEAIGKKLKDVIKPVSEYPGQSEERIQKIGTQGYNREELRYTTPYGEVWVDTTIQVMKEGDKQYGHILTAQDVTARKRAEKAIQDSEEKFSKAFSSASDAMAIFSFKGGKFLEVNDSYVKLSGYSREELIHHNADELNMWGKPEDRENILRKMVEKGRVVQEEFSFRTKSGEIRTCLFSAEPVNIGGERRMIGVIQDITERKQMETALQDSEEKFSKAFNASANAISIKSLKTNRYIDANESFTRFTGYTREEVVGHNAGELDVWVNPEEKKLWTDTVQKEGRVFNQEFSSRMKSGETRFGLGSSDVINIGGGPCRMVVITDITERKKAGEALKESEEKFSKAFNASANAICITSLKDNRFIEANESFTRFTGYAHEEVIGRNAVELGLWVNQEELKRWVDTVQKEGRAFNQEFSSRMKSGETRIGLASAEIINIGGVPCRMVVITDITERKQMEMALRESEEKFSKAFMASANAICITSLKDNKFMEVNDSYSRFTGYTREEAIGHTAAELQLWVNDEQLKRVHTRITEDGRFHNIEFNSRMKSGEIRTALGSAENINIGGEPCRIAVITDITERKKAEESLRLLGSVTQQVTDSTIVTDPDFKITYMNKAAQDLFGYSIDEALGTDIALLDVAPLSEDTVKDMRHTLAMGKTWTGMLPKRRKDGSTFLCDCRRSPMFDENGQLTSYIIVHRDVTEQKEIEAKLKAHKQLIESILTSMPEGVLVTGSSDMVVLANESFRRIFHTGKKAIENKLWNETIRVEQLTDLYKSMKKGITDNNSLEFRYKVKNQEKIIACGIIKMDGGRMLLTFTDISRIREEEDKLYLMDRLASLGEMAAGLAHELNNPLTGILTLSQLLVNSDISEEQKEDLQCVYSEAKRAANIVKNVLLFTRNNSYENGQSSVNEVVKEVLRLREHEEKTNNINVVTNLQDHLPEIPLDKYQLQQVFLNIILNAEAAMKETGRPGTLTVTTERVNNHVNIMFGDTGCGIKKDVLPRIFDPFFTTKDIGKGTGLGLSICYGIIVKHAGKISVKTQVGKGTIFTIRMPIVN